MENLFEMAGAAAPAKDPLASEINSALGADRDPNNAFTDLGNEVGVGTIPASEEEQQALAVIMDGVEQAIHGPAREDIVSALSSTNELWMNIAMVAENILEGAYTKMVSQGVDVEPDIFLGENGVVQSTVEMLYEVALFSNAPNARDTNQLDMAYMKTMQLIGESLFEDDDASVAEAQMAMFDMEFGEGASDLAEEAFNEMEFAGSSEDAMFAEDMLAMQGAGEYA